MSAAPDEEPPRCHPDALERFVGCKSISLWGLHAPHHTLGDVLTPDYFERCADHGLRVGDRIFAELADTAATLRVVACVHKGRGTVERLKG